jgi:hypothetical protein
MVHAQSLSFKAALPCRWRKAQMKSIRKKGIGNEYALTRLYSILCNDMVFCASAYLVQAIIVVAPARPLGCRDIHEAIVAIAYET